MDPDSIADPLLYLCVRNFPKNTTQDSLKELLISKSVEGFEHVDIIKKNKQKPYAAIKFRDAESAYRAVKLVNKEDQNGHRSGLAAVTDVNVASSSGRAAVGTTGGKDEIAVSFFSHCQLIIKGKSKYKDFIIRLCDLLVHRKDGFPEYIVEEKDGQPSTSPVLGEQQGGKRPKRWIHIELTANEGGDQESTTLVIRDDNLYVKGFTGKDGKWFELCEDREPAGEKLPPEYKATKLWGCKYDNLMKLNDNDQVKKTLKSTKLGKAFAERAVRRLSRYCRVDNNDDIPVRLGLAGLIVMICEAARFRPLLDHFAGADCWENGKGLEPKVVDNVEVNLVDLIWNWKSMSAALLKWRGSKGSQWNEECGAKSADDALKYVHLVLKPKDTDVSGRNKAHVEILQVSANFGVGDINVIDDRKQKKQNIYTKEPEQASKQAVYEEKMAPLEVIVRKGISGYAWFDMEVNGCSILPAGEDSIKMRWDCEKVRDATQLVTRDITLGAGGRIRFTYLVMSNPVQATVAIKLRLPEDYLPNPFKKYSTAVDGGGGRNYTARGIISACISDFKHYPIVLFRSDEKKPIESKSLTLELDRSAIQVPQGKLQLQIDMGKLHIGVPDGSSNREVRFHSDMSRLSFDVKDSNPSKIIFLDDGSELEVKVTWKGIIIKTIKTKPEVVWKNIADKKEFTRCIGALGVQIAQECQDVLKDCKEDELPSDCTKDSHPVITRPDQRLTHVKLQVGDVKSATTGEGSSVGALQPHASVTLAILNHYCCGVGFLNQSGVWYDLGFWGGPKILPEDEYNSVLLNWGRGGALYEDILGVDAWGEVEKKLDPAKLGRAFATDAVRVLSRYPDVEEDENPRLALAGILFMVCESAKLKTLHQYFLGRWDNGSSTGTPSILMNDIRNWREISRALLYWRANSYTRSDDKWLINLQTGTASVPKSLSCPQDAHIVQLMFNYCPREAQAGQIFMIKEYARSTQGLILSVTKAVRTLAGLILMITESARMRLPYFRIDPTFNNITRSAALEGRLPHVEPKS